VSKTTSQPLPLPSSAQARDALYSELRLVFGIGEAHDRLLRADGHASIPSLVDHPRFGPVAAALLKEWEDPPNPDRVHATLRTWLPAAHPLFLELLGMVDEEAIVFFDLETLGLFGVPIILAAFGRPERGSVRVTQYVARSIAEEPALLEAALGEIADAQVVLSYNGKAFDWTTLRERSAYYGLTFDSQPIHIDLLHHARRAFGARLPDLHLHTVEEHVFGLERTGDLPSDQVPVFYERYLQTGDPRALLPIVTHNHQDVLSLAALLGHLIEHAL
jgi:uncharacterized protein